MEEHFGDQFDVVAENSPAHRFRVVRIEERLHSHLGTFLLSAAPQEALVDVHYDVTVSRRRGVDFLPVVFVKNSDEKVCF